MKNKIKYFFKRFIFLKALNSPFKSFKLKWYIGKIAIGTPYFFPRKWIDLTEKEIQIKAQERYDKLDEGLKTKVTLKHYKNLYKGEQKCVPKLFSFDFVELGWKTKWTDTDYRFEHSPLISFVFFKWQIAVIFSAPEPDHYWTSWLYYQYNTDKSKSQKERIKQCQQEFTQNWISYKDGKKESINYYKFILKEKYL